MKHKHASEIIRWANTEEGIGVWVRGDFDGATWLFTQTPTWKVASICIVDDEWQELRRAQIDGKQLQCLDWQVDGWNNEILDYQALKLTTLSDWRIKPEEPVYEWQWLYLNGDMDSYKITNFLTEMEANDLPFLGIDKYNPSKRKRK